MIATAEATVAVSALTGAGIPALRAAIRHAVRALEPEPAEELPIVTRARHVAALREAQAEVAAFIEAWQKNELPTPVVATHLRSAVHALEELLGAIDADEVLARVFRTFCIGK